LVSLIGLQRVQQQAPRLAVLGHNLRAVEFQECPRAVSHDVAVHLLVQRHSDALADDFLDGAGEGLAHLLSRSPVVGVVQSTTERNLAIAKCRV
jgi:hypothetical protein